MSEFSNYVINIANKLPDSSTIVSTVDNVTYQQYESGNPLRLNYIDDDTFESEKVKKTVDTAQTLGAEVYSVYSNPFYIFHKLLIIGKYMFKEYNKLAAAMIIKHQNSLNESKKNMEEIIIKQSEQSQGVENT